MQSILQCMDCDRQYPVDQVTYTCLTCGGLLDVQHDLHSLRVIVSRQRFDERLGALHPPFNSGVWRYRELIYPGLADEQIITRPEGNTNLYSSPVLAAWAGLGTLWLKHEGENPTGSFKDRGMTGGVTQARLLGMQRVACASTGNTSASLAAYAALAGLEGIVFFENREIALGKLAQAIAYGATCIQVSADFDRNLELVRNISEELGIYVLNSVNPFRLEGQKSIIIEAIHQLGWQVPDWIVCPGGNLGNSAAFGKALHELLELGLIERVPRVAIIQAEGASPLYHAWRSGFDHFEAMHANTIATAIKIGNPVNWQKAARTLHWTEGVVEIVSDQEIMDAKARIDAQGIGCEPASACSLAGARKLARAGVIGPDESVIGILTGNVLKDPDATINYHRNTLPGLRASWPNHLHQAEPSIEQISDILQSEEPVPV